MTQKLPVIFLVGPTAVGKSALAIELAKKINAEIVSCDAMQVYREACIASDKPLREAQGGVPHHLIDVVSVEEEFNAARYRVLATAAIADIHARGKMPLVVGGSGMYMAALLDGLFDDGEPDENLRAALARRSAGDLYAELMKIDPAAAQKIAFNDKRRTARALEVFYLTGVTISEQQKKRSGLWDSHDVRIIALEREREELYRRVEARVDDMFARGLVDEVKSLLTKKLSLTAARIIGIPEVDGFLRGEYSLEHAKNSLKLHTRHYVKRQMTWFRKDKRLAWLMLVSDESASAAVDKIQGML